MHLCILSTSYPRNSEDDAGIFVRRLVEALEQENCSGIVVVPRDKDEPSVEAQGSFRVYRYRYGLFSPGRLAFGAGILPNLKKNPLRIFQAPLLLLRMVTVAFSYRSHYEVIQANWVMCGLAAWILSLLTGKPFVLTVRGEDAKLLQSKVISWTFKPMLGRAKALVTVNERFRDNLISDYRLTESKVFYIPNGVHVPEIELGELQDFLDSNSLSQDDNYFLFVGRLIPLKQVEKLINLLSQPTLQSFKLLICGGAEDRDYENTLRNLVVTLQVQERVKFCGRVSPQLIPFYLRCARCYLSASSYEGRSNSILEALAAGLVVIASDIPGHREVIKDGANGMLIDFDNPEQAAVRVQAFLCDPHAIKAMGQAAQESVRQYSWQESAKRYLSEFNRLLKS